jgi:hypothetical protein
MKKNYSKPEIVFESFKLSTSVAGNCDDGYKANSGDITNCEIYDNGMSIFGDINGSCFFKGDETKTCYHVPIDTIIIFSS